MSSLPLLKQPNTVEEEDNNNKEEDEDKDKEDEEDKEGECHGTYHRGLHRRAPCSCVHLAYSLRQLRVGISPPYALDPYD